jgi:hypothetical protein
LREFSDKLAKNLTRGEIKMVHERDDEYEGQEDGEYHFSDDQANYDAEPDVGKPSAPAIPKAAPSAGGMNALRRPLIGVGIFIFLIFLVYKIIAPNTTAPTTEFSQANANNATALSTQKKIAFKPAPVTPAAAPQAPVQVAAQAPQPVAPAPEPAVTISQAPAPVIEPAPVAMQAATPQPASALPSPAPTSQPAASSAQASSIDKLIALQQENTRMINQLESESIQKSASVDAENSTMQGKLQDMNMRISSIEATLARLGRNIDDIHGGNRGNMSAQASTGVDNGQGPSQPMMARPIEPKSIYSVQAIIPGRAWLKSDSGETVTVAEGDEIKNYGRITKIDPYDGIVQIDVGGRTVSLSYGASND